MLKNYYPNEIKAKIAKSLNSDLEFKVKLTEIIEICEDALIKMKKSEEMETTVKSDCLEKRLSCQQDYAEKTSSLNNGRIGHTDDCNNNPNI